MQSLHCSVVGLVLPGAVSGKGKRREMGRWVGGERGPMHGLQKRVRVGWGEGCVCVCVCVCGGGGGVRRVEPHLRVDDKHDYSLAPEDVLLGQLNVAIVDGV
jgi:hypothetical protein